MPEDPYITANVTVYGGTYDELVEAAHEHARALLGGERSYRLNLGHAGPHVEADDETVLLWEAEATIRYPDSPAF